jgi:hypothetical protein
MARRAFLLLLILIATALRSTHVHGQTDPVGELLVLINAERAAAGAEPLYLNERLTAAAQRHSNDMASGEFLSHVGSDGSQFWERTEDAGYVLTIGAQNVLVREDSDAMAAFEQWRSSAANFANMVNPDFREAGLAIAYAPSGDVYFTLLVATRVDFAPPTLTPTTTPTPALTLTPPPTATLAPSPTVFVPSQTPLPTLTPTPTRTVDPTLAVVRQDVVRRVLSDSIARAIRWMMESTPLSPTPTFTLPPTLVPTLIPTATPEPVFDVTLIFTRESFSIINTSGAAIWLEGLSFSSDTASLAIERWQTQFLSASLTNFPRGDCVQAWDTNVGAVLPFPPECRSRHGWIAINPADAFWRDVTEFVVYRYGEPVATCFAGRGRCQFNLTDRLPVDSPPPQPGQNPPVGVPVGPADIQLIYTADSFALVNTAGESVDLTGLGFASGAGIVSIREWDNGFLSAPLDAFPAGDCLQAWPLELPEWPPRPDSCRTRHAWIGVNYTQTFWIDVDFFTVSREGVVLATCSVSAGMCDVDLP